MGKTHCRFSIICKILSFLAWAVAALTGRPYSAYIPLDISGLHCGEPWRGRFDQQREALTADRQRTEAENLYSS
jgi:hypothetical protein